MALPPDSFPPDRPPKAGAANRIDWPPVVLDTQSDREWLAGIFRKSLVAFPFVALAFYVVALAANTLFQTRLGPGFALLFGAFMAPFFFVPSQFHFFEELGCRRGLLFWLVPMALGTLVTALIVLSYVVGSPMS